MNIKFEMKRNIKLLSRLKYTKWSIASEHQYVDTVRRETVFCKNSLYMHENISISLKFLKDFDMYVAYFMHGFQTNIASFSEIFAKCSRNIIV